MVLHEPPAGYLREQLPGLAGTRRFFMQVMDGAEGIHPLFPILGCSRDGTPPRLP